MLKTVVKVDIEQLKSFNREFFSELYVEALVQGNVSKPGGCSSFYIFTATKLWSSCIPPEALTSNYYNF